MTPAGWWVRWRTRTRRRAIRRAGPPTIGLAVTAAVLAAACTWQALDASRSSAHANREQALATAYQEILESVEVEYTAQLRYLSVPYAAHPAAHAAAQRTAYEAASLRLARAADHVRANGSQADRALTSYVLLEDRQYAETAQQVFAAVDEGQIQRAQAIEDEDTGPAVDTLLTLVNAAADLHSRSATNSIDQLTVRSRQAAAAIPAAFGVALLLLAGCWALLLLLQRDLRQQTAALVTEKALLATVISSSPQSVYWKDSEGHYGGANQAFADLREMRAVEDVLGQTEGTLTPPSPLAAILSGLEREVLDTGSPALDRHAHIHRSDGAECRLLLSVLPKPGSVGVDGVIGVGVDVTRLTELERQAAQTSRLESVGQLAAGVAHEINTPVQFVTDNTRFITESFTQAIVVLQEVSRLAVLEQPDGRALRAVLEGLDLPFLAVEVPDALAESREGLERVAGIVRAMKDFAHPGQTRTECHLNRAVENTAQVCRNEWKYVAELHLDLDPALDTVSCYEGELKQALLNIIVNAAQAIGEERRHSQDPGLGRIDVATTRLPDAVRITISDDGPGMDEKTRLLVFDPFFTTKEVGKGTGQGLNLVYATVVARHGGSIDVTSAPGNGATFTITLPAKPSPPAPLNDRP